MVWWVVRPCKGEPGRCHSFADEAAARAFMAEEDEQRWELTCCDPAKEPWIFTPDVWWERFPPPQKAIERHQQGRKAIQNYYAGICDHVLAFTWSGLRVEGPLDQRMRAKLRRGSNWFGMQMYKGDRTLYHLDDGCDNWFVVDGEILHHLEELGLAAMIHPVRPGDTLWKADERWTGG